MNPSLPTSEWFGVSSPLVILALGGVLLLLSEVWKLPERRRYLPAVLGIVVIFASFFVIFFLKPYIYTQQLPMGRMFVYDSYARYFQILFLLISFLGCLAIGLGNEGRHSRAAHVTLLLMFCTAVTLLAVSADLVVLYVAGELAVVIVYIFSSRDGRFSGSMKTIRTGMVASAGMLLGLVLLFGMSGSTNLWEISGKLQYFLLGEADSGSWHAKAAFLISLGLLFSGLMVRMGAFPFQGWMGLTISQTGASFCVFLSTGIMASSLAAAARILWILHIRHSHDFAQSFNLIVVISVVAILTLLVGTIRALSIKNFRKFMAFSGIAHTGLLLMSLASLDREGIEAMLLYLAVYAVMTSGLFFVFSGIEKYTGDSSLKSFEGLSKWSPLHAEAVTVFLFSLIGLPLTAGFTAKYALFRSLLNNAQIWFKLLAVVGIGGCLASAVYYGRIIYSMYFRPLPDVLQEKKPEPGDLLGYTLPAALMAAALIAAGVYWKPLQQAVISAMMIIEYQY